MKIKARKSTAQLLGDYRAGLARHYAGIRTGRVIPRPGNIFPMNIQHLVESIHRTEMAKHEQAVAKNERQRKLGQA